MKNMIASGKTVKVPAPYALSSGDGALVGTLFGVALTDAASDADVVLDLHGVYELAAVSTDTATVGEAAYWNNTDKKVTSAANDGAQTPVAYPKIGVFLIAKTSGQTSATIRLNGAF